MNKFKVILVVLIVVISLGIGASLLAYHKGTVAVGTPYVTLVPDTDERIDAVGKGAYKLYRFPVVTDGRPYTIVVDPISGRPELYASRYQPDVDELVDLLSWWCDDDHCGQSATYSGFQTFTFYSPIGEPSYYSWFAVYGDTATEYRVKVVNEASVVQASTVVLPNEPLTPDNSQTANGPTNLAWVRTDDVLGQFLDADTSGNPWYALSYNGNGWVSVQLPDDSWTRTGYSRFYRGKFNLTDPNQDLFFAFESDDGMELYVNSQKVGQWGGAYGTQLGCVNRSCVTNKVVAPINIRPYLRSGDNVIAVRVYNAYAGGYFSAGLQQ